MAIQKQLLQRLATPHEADPLRKLREKDPQFPQFTGRTEHFLAWITERQMRKEQRNLQDAVAIQYAKMARGETARGLFDATREFATWEKFMQAFKPKFLLHTAEYQLLVETNSWQINGD